MKKSYLIAAMSVLSFNLTWLNPAAAFPPWDDSREPSYRDDYYDSRDDSRIEREKERLELERERLDYERAQFNAQRYNESLQKPPAAPPASVRAEVCPSGFVPSEQKCTNQERKHGCKDVRLSGGLGCVHRGH